MPLRDRKAPVKSRTSETLAQLEQQVQAISKQLSERFELLQVPQQQEVDRKTARQAVEYEREYEMVVLPFRHWDPSAIINAKSLADEGDLEMCTDLWESALADDRVASAMEQRINGLEGLPVRFTGDGEDVLEAISTDFWQMMKPGDRALTRRWAYGVGICPVYATEIVENGDGRQILILEPWSPRFLRWRQGAALGKREWWIQTARGQIKLADQPGRWFLFTPFSGSNQRPWVDGLWYSTATWFLAKSFGIADLASFSQSHATPKWFLMPKEGAQISGPEKAEAIRRLAALPQRSGMYIPAGFTVEQKETTSQAWNAITALIELANKALTVRIIGTDSTTDKESSFASTAGGMQLLYVKFRTDADAESAFWHDGPLQFWYLLNFRGARKLQDRRVLDLEVDPITGVYRLLDESDRRQVRRSEYGQRLRQLSEQIRGGDEVPWPTRDATPPEDMAAVAETQGKAAAALVQLAAASTASALMGAAIAQIDLSRYLERYFPMQAQDESGVQLEMEDGTILELGKGKTGSGWITINGTHVYATPGRAVSFKDLKMTKGGQSTTGQKSEGAQEKGATARKTRVDVLDAPDNYTEAEFKSAMLKEHIGKEYTDDEIPKLFGERVDSGNVIISERGITAEVRGAGFEMHRTLYRDERYRLVCHNEAFDVTDTGKGLGTKLFGEQVDSLKKAGVVEMRTTASRGGDANGYYTWARLGYDAPLPQTTRGKLPSPLAKARNVSDLMRSEKGRTWWKENGHTIDMTFDMRDSSPSMKVFRAYQAAKEKK